MIIKFSVIKLIILLLFNYENNKIEFIPHRRICESIYYMMPAIIFCKKKTHFNCKNGINLSFTKFFNFSQIYDINVVRIVLEHQSKLGINSSYCFSFYIFLILKFLILL